MSLLSQAPPHLLPQRLGSATLKGKEQSHLTNVHSYLSLTAQIIPVGVCAFHWNLPLPMALPLFRRAYPSMAFRRRQKVARQGSLPAYRTAQW